MVRIFARACFATFLVLVAGCAGKVETVHTDAGFEPAVLEDEIVALGGFVASSRLAADLTQEMPRGLAPTAYLAQSDAWSYLLYGQILSHAPDVQVWPWVQVKARADSVDVAAAHAIVARGGILPPEQIERLAADLPEVRFLAVARLDRNEVSLHESTEQKARASWEREHLDNETYVRDRALVTRRRVAVTLDLYDLREGRSVWTARATREAKELYNFDDPVTEEIGGEESGLPDAVRVKGTPRQGPPLEGLLETACGKLVEKLVGVGEEN